MPIYRAFPQTKCPILQDGEIEECPILQEGCPILQGLFVIFLLILPKKTSSIMIGIKHKQQNDAPKKRKDHPELYDERMELLDTIHEMVEQEVVKHIGSVRAPQDSVRQQKPPPDKVKPDRPPVRGVRKWLQWLSDYLI